MPSTTSGQGDEIQAKASRTAQQPAPRRRELRADADIQHQQSQHGQPGCARVDAPAGARAHDITGLAD